MRLAPVCKPLTLIRDSQIVSLRGIARLTLIRLIENARDASYGCGRHRCGEILDNLFCRFWQEVEASKTSICRALQFIAKTK